MSVFGVETLILHLWNRILTNSETYGFRYCIVIVTIVCCSVCVVADFQIRNDIWNLTRHRNIDYILTDCESTTSLWRNSNDNLSKLTNLNITRRNRKFQIRLSNTESTCVSQVEICIITCVEHTDVFIRPCIKISECNFSFTIWYFRFVWFAINSYCDDSCSIII